MSTRTIRIALCCLVFQPVLYAEEVATLKKQLAAEVDTLNSTASANFVTACINVTREVQQKRIRLYAISSSAKAGTFKEGDFTIQVIYNEELADVDTKVAGAYYQHNNHLILSFAACRYASGDKDFGLRLVRMIAAAHPSLTWSSPKQSPTPIQKILAGLEKNDDSVRQFLDDEKRDWPSYVKLYGP